MQKYGLVCISEQLKEEDKANAFKSMTRKRFLQLGRKKAIPILQDRILHNLELTRRIIEHCHNKGIAHYRLSSSLFPLITDPTLELKVIEFPKYESILNSLKFIGATKKSLGITLSVHPDQYVVLASENKTAVENSIRELNFHAWMLDRMGLPQDYSVPINIHPSKSSKTGLVSSLHKIADRFYANLMKCNQGVIRRLVVENEDKGVWNCSNLYDNFHSYIANSYGHHIPLTFDNLHHRCNEHEYFKLDFKIWAQIFAKTWMDYTPVFHFSWGREDKPRSHSDYFGSPLPDYGFNAIWECEVKAKDKAIQKLLKITR